MLSYLKQVIVIFRRKLTHAISNYALNFLKFKLEKHVFKCIFLPFCKEIEIINFNKKASFQ